MAAFANKLLRGLPNEGTLAEGYFPRGCRHEKFLENIRENTAAYRGVQMLIQKMNKLPYQTELIIPEKEMVPIAPAIRDLSKAVVALVTTATSFLWIIRIASRPPLLPAGDAMTFPVWSVLVPGSSKPFMPALTLLPPTPTPT